MARRGRVAPPGRLVAAAGLLALALALAASVALGTTGIALERTLTAFTAYDGSREHVIVMTVRAPRAVLAAAVGAALGVAGAVMQALSRNPLAEPGILGISWGAALAAVTAQLAFSVSSLAVLASVALLGAAAAGLAVLVLGALGRRGLTPSKLVVAGAAVSTLLWSVLQGILVVDRQSLEGSRRWLAGSLVGRDLDDQRFDHDLRAARIELVDDRANVSIKHLGCGDDQRVGRRIGLDHSGQAAGAAAPAGAATGNLTDAG